jgi:antirestriction protein ArdC
MAKGDPMSHRVDVHEQITNRIIEAIERGMVAGAFKLPWHRPAGSITRPTNIESKKAYRGINVVTLWVEAQLKGYSVPVWGTYKQFQETGCQVRKGEKASMVVFYKEIEFQRDTADQKPEDDGTGTAWMARGYYVFNAEQTDGYELPERPPVVEIDRNTRVESFMANTGIEVRNGGHSAYYRPSEDYIQMPDAGLFTGTDTSTATEAYYATLLHEGIHASGHRSRLDRNFSGRFGTQERSAEELCAELGAAFLCADLCVTPHLRDDHAHYIAHWLEIMKGDKKAIFTAAAAANRAAEYLHGLQPPTT